MIRHRWRGILVAIVVAGACAAGGWAWQRYQAGFPERTLEQARAALRQGDRLETERLATLLEQEGHAEHAHLIRGEKLLAEARAAGERAAILGRWDSVERRMRILVVGATAAQWPVLTVPATPFADATQLPTSMAATPRGQKRRQFEDAARAGLRQAYAEFRQVKDDDGLRLQAVLHAAECLLLVKELGGSAPVNEAVKLLQYLVTAQPDNVEAHRWLASIYVDLNAYYLAVEQLREVTRLDKTDPRPYRMLGWLLKEMLQGGQAIDAYREALRLEHNPEVTGEIVQELAEALLYAGKPDLSIFNLCSEVDRRSAMMLTLKAECLTALNRRDEAAPLLDEALRADPDSVRALLARSQLYVANDQFQAALPLLLRAAQVDPIDTSVRHQLAEVYQGMGDLAKAKEQRQWRDRVQKTRDEIYKLGREAQSKPLDDAIRLRIAELWLSLNKPAEARVWLRAALTCNPSNRQAREAMERIDK